MSDYIFLFDLDSTITKKEILPTISEKINKTNEMRELTEATMQGVIPFKTSFLKRVDILKNIKRIDRERRDYYRYYTGKSWENLENYDLMINTTKLSYDEMVECVIDYLKMRGLIAK